MKVKKYMSNESMKEAKHVERVWSSQWSVANRGGRMNGEGKSDQSRLVKRHDDER